MAPQNSSNLSKQAGETFWLLVSILAAFTGILSLLGILFLLPGTTFFKGVVASPASDVLDPTQSPRQNDLLYLPPITLETSTSSWTLTPRAEYQLVARVISRNKFSSDWLASVSPLDLALGWGDLSQPLFDDQLHWRQSSRWYFYSWTGDPPLAPSYIGEHSANVHIIPATDNLHRALLALNEDDLILLDGLLVDVTENGKVPLTQYTSLTRTDDGWGACETLYVERLVVAGQAYQ